MNKARRITQHIRVGSFRTLPFGTLLPLVAMSYILGTLYEMSSLIEPGDFCTSFTEHRHITKSSQSDPVYQNRFKESLKAVEESERKGDSPEKIARLVERIINTDSPRLRYRIGPSSTLVGLKHFIPERIVETMITRYYSSNLK